jgi:hypothetical protein
VLSAFVGSVNPKPAAVSGDDRAADSEAEPHPLRLRGEKGLEDPSHFFGRNAVDLVGHG